MPNAYFIKITGVVQGVGFRPFIYRLARTNGLTGWVLNAEQGVQIHLEGEEQPLQSFLLEIRTISPRAANVAGLTVESAQVRGFPDFTIRDSVAERHPTVRISPDLPVCDDCLRELFDPHDSRYRYPYINCTNCGPRYTVICGLPYDRGSTTMAAWTLDDRCATEYADPANRRFHAQPLACANCGPHYFLIIDSEVERGTEVALQKAVTALRTGKVLAVKGLGGYHLSCDAANPQAVDALRSRKYRKEKPFAVMVKDIDTARKLVELSPDAESLLTSPSRPIVLARSTIELSGVAPDNDDLGIMLPYTPLHYLLFDAGAPDILVMTSANRSSEPIAYQDQDALRQLSGIADGFLIGERPIARRVDDSVTRAGVFGPAILRRSRGYAPGAVASLLSERPILAMGADLKNTITLVVSGQAFVSQHIGDLDHYAALCAFRKTVRDLLSMYEIDSRDLLVVHDLHPQYASTLHAIELAGMETRGVQHHRAHVASVLAERGAWDQQVVAVAFDGTGYGDDRTIWGGEIFAGSMRDGFARASHLRTAVLPGGDAAAANPVQAAAGFVAQLNDLPDLTAPPFSLPSRYRDAVQLVATNLRCFDTSSMGRLFDTAAALLGFTREVTFEGQAAMWLERFAKSSPEMAPYPFPYINGELDFRPLLAALICDALQGRPAGEIARAFHSAIASGIRDAVVPLCTQHGTDSVVLSGGVFQNELLLAELKVLLESSGLKIWTNRLVPTNDGGISLGQAAMAALGTPEPHYVPAAESWTAHVT